MLSIHESTTTLRVSRDYRDLIIEGFVDAEAAVLEGEPWRTWCAA